MKESVRIKRLISAAERMPYGDARVSMHEEAVRESDATGDIDLMFAARLSLQEGACFSGQNALSLPAIAWCLAHYNAEPDRFRGQRFTLLWGLKNILSNCHEYPQISKRQFESLLVDMQRLYQKSGYSLRPVHQIRREHAVANGDRAAAEAACREFLVAPRDVMADCKACETNSLVEFYQCMEDHEKTIETAQKIIAGKERCAEVPHETYGILLRPLALLGRYEEADTYHTRGYRLVRTNPTFLTVVAFHMLYLVHKGRLAIAVKMLERHLTWALDTRELRSRYIFYIAARRLFSELIHKKTSVKLNLPTQFPAREESSTYETAALIHWFDQEALTLGQQFDARNDSDYMTKEIVEQLSY